MDTTIIIIIIKTFHNYNNKHYNNHGYNNMNYNQYQGGNYWNTNKKQK